MFPARLKQNPRILILTLIITFISGANFFSVLLFWPTQAFNVYGHDPVGVGIRGLPIGFSILAGAFIVLWLLSVFRGHNRELMIASSVLMTAGKPIYTSYQPAADVSFRCWLSCMCSHRQPSYALGSPGCSRSWYRRYRRACFDHYNHYLSRCECKISCSTFAKEESFLFRLTYRNFLRLSSAFDRHPYRPSTIL